MILGGALNIMMTIARTTVLSRPSTCLGNFVIIVMTIMVVIFTVEVRDRTRGVLTIYAICTLLVKIVLLRNLKSVLILIIVAK